MNPTKQPGLRIAELFLVHAEFSHRGDFLSIDRRGAVLDGDISADFRAGQLSEDTAAVSVRVHTKSETNGAYDFSVEMMAIVTTDPGDENFPPLEYVRMAGVTMMFPFLREAVANLTMRGRFGAVWIRPFNVQAVLPSNESSPPKRTTPTDKTPPRPGKRGR